MVLSDFYTLLPGKILARHIYGPFADELVCATRDGVATYFHADSLGSVVKATDALGTVTSVNAYGAWGTLEIGADPRTSFFTGRNWDANSGLYYYRSRYYDPTAGRFLSEDTIRFAGGMNFYSYALDNPATLMDPSGHGGTKSRVKKIAKAAGSLVGAYEFYVVAKTCYKLANDCDTKVMNFCNQIPPSMAQDPLNGTLFDQNESRRIQCVTEKSACCRSQIPYMAGQAGWNEIPILGHFPPPKVLDPPACDFEGTGQSGERSNP
jgi:RHS repeat-associated protein